YKNSEQAIFTPDDFVSSIQLQSSKESLAGRQDTGINKTLLSYDDFRKALAIGFDRDDYARRCTTSSLAGLGLFNSMHYYDVENGGVYRDTDYAKRVLCDVYAVNPNDFASLDDAVESITGYNLTEARRLVDKAYDEAIAAGDLKATDKVKLTVGSGAITIATQRTFDWFEAAWTELMKGTKLEGKFELEFVDKGTKWADDFRDGAYDIILGGGWSGAAWDPGYMLLAYLSPDYMYSAAWDTSSETMTFTMKGVGENGADVTETMSLMDWYDCLNGNGGKYNWAQGEIDDDIRCSLIAALEGAILKKYYSVPIAYSYGSSLLSYRADYITREYNTFMAYGGIRYMTYHYTDAAWSEYVSSQGGTLDYTK
ncbi:MAG: hypothetical protein K2N65_06085, partial [Anaeroplasmataceae bacterium]|nr:hypothetical protein [Anaeroplasmataceae bacterium]